MHQLVIYIHGKGGNAAEAEHYRPLFPEADVVGFDYTADTPWDAQKPFSDFFDAVSEGYAKITLIANSIGAFFAMHSLAGKQIDRAFFISPIADMEALILRMMAWAGVSEEELCARGEIPTAFGETLSYAYLCYVRAHPIEWHIPTAVLYGETDHLQSLGEISAFCARIGAALTVMPQGEHWFHTPEQMQFADRWMKTAGR